MYNELFNKVIEEIPINKSDKTIGITFIALPGVGKSTISKMISDKTNFYITANDKIRRIAEKMGINPEENREMIAQIANDRTVYMLKNNISMIIDANMTMYWNQAVQNFKNHNAKLYFIKLECDEEEILRRIDERAEKFDIDTENLSRAKRDIYFKELEKSKKSNFPNDLIFYTINTNETLENIEKQVDELLKKIERNINE